MEHPEATTNPPRLASQSRGKTGKQASTRKFARTLLILVIVVFLCLVGIIEAYRHNRKVPAPITPAPVASGQIQPAQVNITSSGFTPQTIRVPANTQLTWTNNDSANHEVAADPYPKDNSIPGFDSSVLLQKGQSYSFIFTKSGTYTYHDELNPYKFEGTVVVTTN